MPSRMVDDMAWEGGPRGGDGRNQVLSLSESKYVPLVQSKTQQTDLNAAFADWGEGKAKMAKMVCPNGIQWGRD